MTKRVSILRHLRFRMFMVFSSSRLSTKSLGIQAYPFQNGSGLWLFDYPAVGASRSLNRPQIKAQAS
ncbi:hypothetical protein E1A91_A07G233600v1 [Gossypium mustelinum]|uniref:Uncharacterized protein n=1 Tax=Gossypium mustelinum TaxID=34275 RepID=A0A5D2YQ57_GOSMU|nr:hypothetical protein E1A91_A07G233600v1 [Gossypium mustelinum]